MDISEERVAELIAASYSAALGQLGWQDYCNAVDAALGGGNCVAIHGQDMKANINLGIVYTGFRPDFIDTYAAHYSGLNPYVSSFFRAPVGAKLTTEDMVDIPALMKSEFYNDWLRPQEDVWPGCGVVLFHDDSRVLVFGGQLRARETDDKFDPMMKLLNVLTPHLTRAFDIQRAVALSQMAETRKAMDVARDGIVVVDVRGRVRHMNSGASKYLDQQDLIRVNASGALFVADDRAQALLRRALGSSVEPACFFVRSAGGNPVALLTVTPIQRDRPVSFVQPFEDHSASHLVTITAPANGFRQDARRLLGLSAAEIAVAEALAAGLSLREIAEAKGRSLHTVRNQVRSILEKTDTRRQAELISVLSMLQG
jgi:DNA-binding CsgD family transcriptional regulator